MLIRQYRDPELYRWVQLEADDTANRALDDVIAARTDGSYEFVQVKFTPDPGRYELDWDWLLGKKEHGSSMLAKWTKSLAQVAAMGRVHSAGLKTNRIPAAEFAKCLKGSRVDLDLLPKEIRKSVEDACGGAAEANAFFQVFEFWGNLPDLDEYESNLRDQLVPTDTDLPGWHAFRHHVRRWAMYKNQPEPDGLVLREHVVQLITKRRPQPIRQDFVVPDGYSPPSQVFDNLIRGRVAADDHPITILWGTPGRGKSTYLSYLTQQLQKEGAAITRHHYFLSAEDSSANRTSFIEIAASLIAQLHANHPEAMAGLGENDDQLRADIRTAAARFAAKGQRLCIVIDGLDQVWRDTQRVDQLNHLFNELLPLPANVNLIVGTQRVPDEQLPGKLLTIAKDNDWIEIPRMDEVAVYRWVVQQDKARPLLLQFDPTPERRIEIIDEIAKAFFKISKGHPLHLIYAYEALVRAGRPTSAEEIELLPACPDGDIRAYYRGLWVRLSASAKNALHMLSGSDFFWPSLGIRQVLGDFSEIDHLLEPRHVGMVPFHSSIFAWVRERGDHAESYQALLPKIIQWLDHDAPEYWKWGWLWLAKAREGNFKDLLSGATRDWVVESLANGWPVQQIENILAVAETKTFADGDLARTVSLRGLKTRVSNSHEYQARDFAAYRATALAVSHNRQQTLNLLDEIHDLSDSEVTQLARLGPEELAAETRSTCFNELARRVNAWIALRHRPGQDFTKLSDQLLSVSALMDEHTVRRTLRYVRGFRDSTPHVSRLIRLLGKAQNTKGLQLIRSRLRGAKWKDQRRLLHDALLRVAAFAGADVIELVPLGPDPLSPFAASWFLWRDRGANLEVDIPPIAQGVVREQYSLGENADVTSFFYDAFWVSQYVGLRANGHAYSTIYPGLGNTDLGWLPRGLSKLDELARRVANEDVAPTFSAVYSGAADLEPMTWGARYERDNAQYRAFRKALRRIAIDMHFLGLTGAHDSTVPASELAVARKSIHWADELWVTRNVDDWIPLLHKDAAEALLTDEANSLEGKVTEFSERSERWTQLANLARLYDDGRQAEFIVHAAECLVGYGWRKDLSVLDVLDAVVETSTNDAALAMKRLETLVPIIDVITEFTDGDETNHARSELIEVVAKVSPERLPSLYAHHLSADEHSYADECLIELAKRMDLETPEAAALARTFLDERTLAVLEDRASSEPVARALLDRQNVFLGRTAKPSTESKKPVDALSKEEEEAIKVNPASFRPTEFAALVEAASGVHYAAREEFMTRWLHHWRAKSKASRALRSILSYFETSERTLDAEKILDEAFLVSLAVEGKEAAYPWLVKAHVHRHGWHSYYTSENETMRRLKLAAQHYPDRWQAYIKDTSTPAPFYRRRRYSFVIGMKYLVRFLMLVEQVGLADEVTASLVKSLVDEVREQPIADTPWFH